MSDARIALSGASAHPFRCVDAEQAVIGSSLDEAAMTAAAQAAESAVTPQTDAVASEWYRRRMTGVFVRPGAGGARLTTLSGRQGWKTS